uniref:C-type lectin domain-containing protein n=1 Tax=Astyanax mexicanus TaxID=7994 RepID=A0A3B1KIE7_ASTMX
TEVDQKWLPIMTGSDRYIFINEKKIWSEAQSYCRANHTDLASVRNQTENKQISEKLNFERNVWIGLFKDTWEWSDQSSSSFRYWKSNPGGIENCTTVSVNDQGLWRDQNCNMVSPFICHEGELHYT